METLKFYLLYIPLMVISTIFLLYYLKKKDENQVKKVLLYLSILAFLLHVTKIFFYPYNTHVFPNILRKSTFENVCAVSALLLPIVYVSKNNIAKDYIVIFGMIGGFAAFMYPTEIILGLFDSMPVDYKLGLFSYDTIRFYLVHYILFIVPALMLYFKIHTLNIKRIIYFPISVLIMLLIVYINELILHKIGWLDDITNYFGKDMFLDNNIRNSSFVFGIPDSFKGVGKFIDILVPSFLKDDGTYTPVLWIVLPCFIYGPIIYIMFYYCSNFKETFNRLKRKTLDN